MPETPAEELRTAAKLMRERAEGCEPRRWYWEALGEKGYPQRITSEGNVTLIAECFIDPGHRPYEAEHIASWHPLVALAVADVLDKIAWMVGLDAELLGRAGVDETVAIARVYLEAEAHDEA